MSDAAYDRIGVGYREFRREDPRIAARIEETLGDARTPEMDVGLRLVVSEGTHGSGR